MRARTSFALGFGSATAGTLTSIGHSGDVGKRGDGAHHFSLVILVCARCDAEAGRALASLSTDHLHRSLTVTARAARGVWSDSRDTKATKLVGYREAQNQPIRDQLDIHVNTPYRYWTGGRLRTLALRGRGAGGAGSDGSEPCQLV